MGTVVVLFLFGLELFLYLSRSKYFIQYTFVYASSITFISYKLNFIFANQGMVTFYFSVIVVFFIEFLSHKRIDKRIRVVFISIVTLLLYLIFIYTIRGADLLANIDFLKHYYWGVLLFLVISKYKKVSLPAFNKFLMWFVILLSSLGIAQFIFPKVNEFLTIDLTKYGYVFNVFIFFKRVTGPFLRPANYGDLMAILVIYLFSVLVKTQFQIKQRYLYFFAIILGFIVILLTGIRTAFFSMFIGILISTFIYNKKIFYRLLVSLILIYVLFITLIIQMGEVYNNKNETNTPIERIAYSIYIAQLGTLTETSTLHVSGYLIGSFYNSPIIGSNHIDSKVIELSITDAYLLYHAVRFGTLGLLIILFPYLYFLYIYRKNENIGVVLVIFIVLLLQTITDSGLFSKFNNPIFWIIFGVSVLNSQIRSTDGNSLNITKNGT